jgi:large subunit ribosomal protein L29
MDAEKIRNLTEAELQQQERELNDQLFRLKFQLRMGQTESLKKIRGLRKDVARVKTIIRQKELGIPGPAAPRAQSAGETTTAEVAPSAAKPKRADAKKTVKKASAKKAGAKKASVKKATKTRKR